MEGAKFLKYLIDLKCRINILQKVVILWMDKAAGRVWGKGNREGIGLFHTTLSPVLSSRMPPSPCVSFSLSVSLTHKHSLHVASKHQPLFCLKADGTCNVMGGAQALKWSLDFTPTCFSWAWKTSSFSPEVQFPNIVIVAVVGSGDGPCVCVCICYRSEISMAPAFFHLG